MSVSAGPSVSQYKSVSYPGPGTVNQGSSVSSVPPSAGVAGGLVTQTGLQFVTQGGTAIRRQP